MTKKELEEEIFLLEKEIKRLNKIINDPFDLNEGHSRIALSIGDSRLYITKPYDADNRLDLHCNEQIVIIPNASNSVYIQIKENK